ncbi:MAG: hypothetical protein K8T26_15885 [Lentisphaerae bacterium]|nr:hypothetical protein [Lentisphaerota bacterium]
MFLLPVHDVQFLAPDIFELELERRGYPFAPGECAVLFDGGDESRPYSLASGPAEDVLRFLIRRLPKGAVSTWLSGRRRGDGVRISTPFGRFHPGQEGPPGAPSVFVATGVGIAPFLSWAHQMLPARQRPSAREEGGLRNPRPLCLYGVRHLRDAVHVDLLRHVTDLRVAVSRDDAAPGHHHGRVTDLLPQLPLEPGTQYYLCGLDAMVDEVARWLVAQGVGHDEVHTEVFFTA